MRTFAQQAVACGVSELVLLAGRGEPEVFPAEQAVRESGAQFTILRCAFFAQNFSEGALVPSGDEIAFPAANVTEPFIDVGDVADIAVAVLTDPQRHAGQTYDLTGPRLLSFETAVEEIARAAARPLRYLPVPFERYADLLAPLMPPDHVGFESSTHRLLEASVAPNWTGTKKGLGELERLDSLHSTPATRPFSRCCLGWPLVSGERDCEPEWTSAYSAPSRSPVSRHGADLNETDAIPAII